MHGTNKPYSIAIYDANFVVCQSSALLYFWYRDEIFPTLQLAVAVMHNSISMDAVIVTRSNGNTWVMHRSSRALLARWVTSILCMWLVDEADAVEKIR